MSKMMVYALKGTIGGNVEKVWGHEMQVMAVDSSDKEAVSTAKADGYSNSPNDVIEQIEAQKMQRENDKMKAKLGGDSNRVTELEEQLTTALEEIAELEQKLAIYEETKDKNSNGKVDYSEMTNAELQKLLDQRNVDYNKRDGKDALIQAAKNSE